MFSTLEIYLDACEFISDNAVVGAINAASYSQTPMAHAQYVDITLWTVMRFVLILDICN